MLVVLLILLLIAAMTGVILLVWIGSWYAKRRFREFQRQFEASANRDRRRREAYDVGTDPHDQNLRPGDGPGGPMIPRK